MSDGHTRSLANDPALPPPAWAARVPAWAWLLVFAAAAWALHLAGYALTDAPRGIAVAWPVSGLALYALLVSRRRAWPAVLAILFVLGVSGSLRFGRTLDRAVAYNAAHVAESVAAWWIVVRLGGRPTLRTLRGALVLMFAPAVAVCAVSGLAYVALNRALPLADPQFWIFWGGSSLGILFVTTLLVEWSEPSPVSRVRGGPAAIVGVAAALVGALAVLRGSDYRVDEVVLLPPLLWAALQFGARGATVALVVAEVGLLGTSRTGGWHEPFESPETYALALQLLLALGGASILAVAAVGEERRAAEQRRVLLERAMDRTPDPAGIFDEDGTFVWANGAATRKLGLPREEVLGRPIWALVGETPDRWAKRWQRVATLGALVVEERLALPGGEPVPYEVSAALVDAGGQTLMVAVFRDLTDRRRVEESSRLAALGTLSAGVAHEVNNPLSYVVSNLAHVTERLAALPDPDGTLRADVLEPLAEAQDGARRVRDIVRQLRGFARGDEAAGPVDPGRALRAALAMAQNELRHRARVVTALAPTPPVMAAENRLTQVFVNLVVNAAQAIPEGNVERNEVRATLSVRGDEVVAEVSDTGAGLDAATRARIFEPFFTTKAPGAGTGLGLAISHSIVVALGGRIEVESTPGGGSVFRVILPAARGVVVPSEPAPSPGAAAAAPGSPPAVAPRRRRVLVVDDEPLVSRALARLLEGDEVVTEERATAALARIRAGERFDAIVCDLMMPELSGMELHAAVTAVDPALAARFVFVTGGVFTHAARAFLERVPNPCLEKPVDRAALTAALRRIG